MVQYQKDCAILWFSTLWMYVLCRSELQKAEMKGSYAEPEAAESLWQSLERQMQQQVTQMEVCPSHLH